MARAPLRRLVALEAPGCRRWTAARTLGTEATTVVCHTEYSAMAATLATTSQPTRLDLACRFILALSPALPVNPTILNLNALALFCHHKQGATFQEFSRLKAEGVIKAGKWTVREDRVIAESFAALVEESGAGDQRALYLELQTKGCHSATRESRDFVMKRQLVGFYLLQKLDQRRLPVDVVVRLGKVLHDGTFTAADDARILAWVAERGPRDWKELSTSLGRVGAYAVTVLVMRWTILKDRQEGKKSGRYSVEELEAIMDEVVGQDREAVEGHYFKYRFSTEKNRQGASVDWRAVAARVHRPVAAVQDVWRGRLLPTVLRHQAGTLDTDLKAELVEQMKAEGWELVSQVNFKQLAGREEFRGHTGNSLHRMYSCMLACIARRSPGRSKREVTVGEVEEWLGSTPRLAKSRVKEDTERAIVAAYQRARGEAAAGSPGPSGAAEGEFTETADGYTAVYIDCSCSNSSKEGPRAGIGVWWGDQHALNYSAPLEGAEGSTLQCKQTGAVQAAVKAVSQAREGGRSRLVVHTDSRYLVSCATTWMAGWKASGWRSASGHQPSNKAKLEVLDALLAEVEVRWTHVRERAGVRGHAEADRLARAGAARTPGTTS